MAWLLGVLGGFAEYILLKQTLTALLKGQSGKMLLFFLANLCCLLGVLGLVVILWRDQLIACGIIMAGTLILLAAAVWVKQLQSKKEGK